MLTVLDDSSAPIRRSNAEILTEASRRSTTLVSHLLTEELHEALAQANGRPRALWQSKIAPRDIAPLRNLSLLISAAINANTTVLVDDDICGFSLDATHQMLEARRRRGRGLVAGVAIGGISEQDTITKLSDAMRLLESKACGHTVSVAELFRVSPDFDYGRPDRCQWVSAGYLAFHLPATRLFAFPPGYNEDWLWCLLHDAIGDTCLYRAEQTVVHAPPFLRRSTREDILFELAGDLVLDYLAARPRGERCRADEALEGLGQLRPHPSCMPPVRAEEVLEKARELSGRAHRRALLELETYGLGVLRAMRRSGELEMEQSSVVKDWSVDAAAKHRSFAATLGTATALVAVGAMLQEGRL
jgi:hypothetical protein